MKQIDIKQVIKQHRLQAGITMKELADLVGVSEATVSRWESGDIATMKHSQIAKLCNALNISPALLVPGIAIPTPTLSQHDLDLLAAYKAAPDNAKQVVDLTLEPYMPSSSENEDVYA